MLAEKVLAGKSKIEDYFPEYAHYTVPEDGKIFHHLRGLASWDSPFHCSVSYTHTCTFTNTHMLLFSVCEVRQLLHPVLPVWIGGCRGHGTWPSAASGSGGSGCWGVWQRHGLRPPLPINSSLGYRSKGNNEVCAPSIQAETLRV